MDPNALFKGVKTGAIGIKRAVERASYGVMGSVGLSSSPESSPEYDALLSRYTAQTEAIRHVRADAQAAFDALRNTASTSYTLATRLDASLSTQGTARVAVEALLSAHRTVTDEVLFRVERRVKKRVFGPAEQELERAKEVQSKVSVRKRGFVDMQRWRGRDAEEEQRKAREKSRELEILTDELIAIMREAIPRRERYVERAVAETMEFQRRFYLDSAKLMERAVEIVGVERLTALRGSGSEDAESSRGSLFASSSDDLMQSFQRKPPRNPSPPPAPQPRQKSTKPMPSNSGSFWDENDDDDDDFSHPHDIPSRSADNPFDFFDGGGGAFEEVVKKREESSYPSAGVGKRESAGGYPTTGVGSRESVTSYPTGASRQRESAYPTGKTSQKSARPPSGGSTKHTRRNRSETEDLFNFDDTDTFKTSARPKRGSAPATASTEDLLDLGGSDTKSSTSFRRSASAAAMEGDLLGDFTGMGAGPSKSRSTTTGKPRASSPSVATSTSAPSMRPNRGASSSAPKVSNPLGENAERERLKKKHEAEIKARADEKLAAVREREKAVEKERDQKDVARGAAEAKVNMWTGNGTRRGNLRALLATLDTVLYPGATWQSVTMADLKANAKVKGKYHRAILQVHPDKIGSKNLPPDQQVLAELIFDELKNAYEVFTAEVEGRPPPPGSVGPKGQPNGGGGFGMGGMNRAGMYNNMGGMGRGGMGMGGMGNMGGMGMGSMGRGGMGMGGMGGRGMGGRGMGMGGMGGMGYAGTGRRGTGMGNMPSGYGRQHQRR